MTARGTRDGSAVDPEANVLFRYRWALIATASLLLAGLSWVGVMVYQQTAVLQATVQRTEQIIDGNVRVYSQVQRELLRMAGALAAGTQDPETLVLLQQLVGQRVQEGTLDYQVNTLGQPLLLEEAVALAARWRQLDAEVITPLVAGGNVRTDLRADALQGIGQLELAYNRLVSDSEINRRNIAGSANDATAELLTRSRGLLRAGVLTVLTLVLFALVMSLVYRRVERQRAQTARRLEELNANLRILSQVASRTDNAVIITDADGVTTWVNDAFTTLTGHRSERAVGVRPGALLQGPQTDPATVAMMSAELAAGRGFTCEVVNYHRDGSPYWVRLEVQPVLDDAGDLCNFIAVETDITAQRDLEERLRTAKEVAEETAAAKASFVASMSHEIRTPLNAVLGLNSLLLETDLDAQQQEFVRTATASGRLLLDIVNDILSFSALESGNVELEAQPFVLRDLLAETVELLDHSATERGLTLSCQVGEQVPVALLGDPTRVRQILVNLVGNSVKFTRSGGVVVRARVRDTDTPPGFVDLRLSVTDSGIGIAADRLDRLFQPFSQVDASTTRRFGGTGLGLAICRDLVHLMGGEIAVDSRPGEGTTMHVDLRLAVAEPPSGPTPTPGVVPSFAGLRVLLAEDDPVNQMVASHMLARLGVEPVVVADGAQAVDTALAEPFDLILMDVHMPVMDGPTAVRRIHDALDPAARPHVIGFTATALEGDRERLLASGMDGYLAKPVQLEGLADALRSVRPTAARPS